MPTDKWVGQPGSEDPLPRNQQGRKHPALFISAGFAIIKARNK